MNYRGEVLVAIMNDLHDFALAQREHWYRIPVDNVRRRLKDRWPPRRLAFYQTKNFGSERYAVNYVADVLSISERSRPELFPEEPSNTKSSRRYYQLLLSPLQRLAQPILSRRWRYIIFIPTTEQKFQSAVEINDLYDESPLEDRLWAELKRRQIAAERQFWVPVGENEYFLDFAIPCSQGGLALETDGDAWHHNPAKARQDNRRDNDLQTAGWQIFHFTTRQIMEEMASYCVPIITKNIDRLGGVDEGQAIPHYIAPDTPGGLHQLNLFYPPVPNQENDVAKKPLPPSPAKSKPAPLSDGAQLLLFNDKPHRTTKPKRPKKSR
jgi:very-short-patch-repair endonuclease